MKYASRIRMMASGFCTAILLAGSTLAGTAEATTVYTFEGFTYTPAATTANTTASDMSFTSDWGGSCWMFANVACGGYGSTVAEFTVAPLAGYSLTVTGLSFDEWMSDEWGPTAFHVVTSADGFASPIYSRTLAPSAPTFSNHAMSLSLFNLTDPFVVRIVSTGRTELPLSTWFLDNVTLNAEAVAIPSVVPEPATILLLGTGLGIVAKRRRSQK